MKVYLVGGAVRDRLLGLDVYERDWVVVGSSVEAMLAQGFRPVGKDFPVFLHPETQEEYALARTERKVGKGYRGFTFYAEPDVTLEDDLKRRDLTINAIAQSDEGVLVDPFDGQSDVKRKLFRHVSEAFKEDPVRILRLARFAARFPDFTVHPDTVALAHAMTQAGEVDALVAERVWKECARALQAKAPHRFVAVLDEVGAWSRLFPDWPVEEAEAQLHQVEAASSDLAVRWACWVARRPLAWVEHTAARYRIPLEVKKVSMLVVQHQDAFLHLSEGGAAHWLGLLRVTDALRRSDQAQLFLEACFILNPSVDKVWVQKHWDACLQALHDLDIPACLAAHKKQGDDLSGPNIKKYVIALQRAAVDAVLRGT